MDPQPLFNDLFGVMAVICMVPVFFLWLERKTKWRISWHGFGAEMEVG